ncbi:MAG TPA: hypothetical protein VK960_10765 [Acidimicrobiia bacterium]|nr:hypothetical protein [Acidimicrobiia bacterium]
MSKPGGGGMSGGFPAAGPWGIDSPDPGRDHELAEEAVTYLRRQGLDDGAVIQCLRDEFDIDQPTAETIAYRRMGVGSADR